MIPARVWRRIGPKSRREYLESGSRRRYPRYVSRWPVVLALALLVPVGAAAGEVELAVFGGRSIPTYEQTFSYDPGAFGLPTPLPGISISQQGVFALTAKGGWAGGASLAWFPADVFGIEARFDTVGIRGEATGVGYTATVTLPPLPAFAVNLDLPPGVVEVDRLTPLSLGLKLRTPGRVRVFLSAGGSYLPKVEATATQSLAVGISRVTPSIDVTQASIRAAALPAEGQGRWGVTAGIGLQIPLGAKASFQAEVRAFRFQKQTLNWELVAPPAIPALEELLQDAVSRLDPVEFNPTFYQVTAGFALRF